jgi:hypothetical protein
VTWLREDGRLRPDQETAPAPVVPVDRRPDAPALILYTSGSLGKPRGVLQTFRNIDANTRSIVQYLALSAADRAMLVLPLCYCYGRSVLQTHLFAGGSIFLDDRFMYPRAVIEALAAKGCTGFAGVPLTFEGSSGAPRSPGRGCATSRRPEARWRATPSDVKPIAGLYKTQVYALARHLGVNEEILRREPTTDTYSLEQSQEDFYYSLHYSKLDLVLWAKNNGVSAESAATELGFTPEQVRRVYDDVDQKRRATVYLHAPPILLEPVGEVAGQAPLATQIFPTSA